MTYLGWYDTDKRRLPAAKLGDAVARYRAKFGGEPAVCLCHPTEAAELASQAWHGADVPDLEIRAATFIPRFTFYVGIDDSGEAEPATIPAVEGAA